MGGLMRLWWVGLCLARWSGADEPLSPPADYTIRSPSGGCQAFLSAGLKKTTVSEVRRGAAPVPRWEMPGWFRVAALADDCEHFVTGFDGLNLLPLDFKKDQVMLSFYWRGKLLRAVTLPQLVRDLGALRRTVSHYYWGHYQGLDARGRYMVETVEGRRIAFEMTTGEPVPPQ